MLDIHFRGHCLLRDRSLNTAGGGRAFFPKYFATNLIAPPKIFATDRIAPPKIFATNKAAPPFFQEWFKSLNLMIKMIYGTHSMIVIYFCHHSDFEIRPKTGLSPTNPRQRIKKVGTIQYAMGEF